MKRAAIYARVSTDAQRDNYSVPTQVEACLRYAEDRGYSVIGDQYVDPETGLDQLPGKGATLAYVDDISHSELNRPSLDASLLYLDKIGFDILVVHDLDRMARDPYIRQTLEREFIGRGAKVEYVLGKYEDGSARLDGWFAAEEDLGLLDRQSRLSAYRTPPYKKAANVFKLPSRTRHPTSLENG